MSDRPRITVFGSSQIGPDHPEYGLARAIGRGLAVAGYDIVTGGYDGAMAAVSRGAKEGGGNTIGVTLDVFRRLAANPWVDEEVRTETLLERLEGLTVPAVGYVVLPGGVGTLLELALVWNLAVTGVTAHKPMIVVGDGWRRSLEVMRDLTHLLPTDLDLLIFVDDAEAVVAVLQAALARSATP